MTKKIEITDSLRKTQLNNEKREQFACSIMCDVFKKRSDAIRNKAFKWQEKLISETWGKSPQARTANKKAVAKLAEDHKKLKSKGIFYGKSGYSDGDKLGAGHRHSTLDVNMAGRSIDWRFYKKPSNDPVIWFDNEFLAYSRCRDSEVVHVGTKNLTLTADHKLVSEFDKLKFEADAITEAAVEFRLMVDAILKKSRTIGAALDNWSELEKYLPSIMSQSREIIVKPEDLTAKMQAIKSGEDIAKAMKATGADATRVK